MCLLPYVTLAIAASIIAVSLTVIFAFAPIANKNVPISAGQRRKMKKYVRVIAVIVSVISATLYMLAPANGNIATALVMGLGGSALSMLVSKFKAKRI